MTTIMVMFQNVILFAALMAPGFLLGKKKQFERGSVTTITNILMCVGMPFLVFPNFWKWMFMHLKFVHY